MPLSVSMVVAIRIFGAMVQQEISRTSRGRFGEIGTSNIPPYMYICIGGVASINTGKDSLPLTTNLYQIAVNAGHKVEGAMQGTVQYVSGFQILSVHISPNAAALPVPIRIRRCGFVLGMEPCTVRRGRCGMEHTTLERTRRKTR